MAGWSGCGGLERSQQVDRALEFAGSQAAVGQQQGDVADRRAGARWRVSSSAAASGIWNDL